MREPRPLLVEDDPALVELLKWHFAREQFVVEQTPNGEEALLLAAENPPDVVLLDWMIEAVSGIEVCRRLRRARATANVPIIMLTGRGEEADRIRGLETGADDYVTKPFQPERARRPRPCRLAARAPGPGGADAALCRPRDSRRTAAIADAISSRSVSISAKTSPMRHTSASLRNRSRFVSGYFLMPRRGFVFGSRSSHSSARLNIFDTTSMVRFACVCVAAIERCSFATSLRVTSRTFFDPKAGRMYFLIE